MLEPFSQFISRVGRDNAKWLSVADWENQLRSGGYHGVEFSSRSAMVHYDANLWCINNVGKGWFLSTEHYFWFHRKKDAVLFALTWSGK